MNLSEFILTLTYGGLFILLFGLGEILYHQFKVQAEYTRKLVHIGTGMICLSFPFFISTHWSVLILAVSFFLILTLSLKFNFLKSINAVDRVTYGSFLFPMVIYISYWAYSIFGYSNQTGSDILPIDFNSFHFSENSALVFYVIPIFILTISDPIAALSGKKWPMGKFVSMGSPKTLTGSIFFLLSSGIISSLILFAAFGFSMNIFLVALTIALGTTLSEALSKKGVDNLLIPISAIVILALFQKIEYLQ